VSYQVWDLRSGNRIFENPDRRTALLWVLELAPTQDIDEISVLGPGDEILEGEALTAALAEALWGPVERISEPTGAVEVAVSSLQPVLL
jgi:hypothetical protein